MSRAESNGGPGPGPVVIVGASLAGATAAAALREAGFPGQITLLGAETELPYERPGLSKRYLTGEVPAETLRTHPAPFYPEHQITLRLGETVTGLDTGRRLVQLTSGDRLPYGTLVIATGASNIRPPIPGMDLSGLHQLRTLADADRLRSALARGSTAVVVGMGFIGCEISATLTGLGVAVTAVDVGPGPLWLALGPDLSAVARRWHEQRGVRVLTDQSITAFLPDPGGSAVAAVALASGERLTSDLVVVGVGTRPNTAWLSDAPLHLAAGGAVGVDSAGRTNLPGIWAVGDVAAAWDTTRGIHRRYEHWATAIDQAQRAARAIVGAPAGSPAAPYFWSDQYDNTLQYSGAHESGDALVVRGDLPSAEPFTAFYLRDRTVNAVVAVNDGKQFRRAQRLIGRAVNPADLTDLARDLRELAAPTQPAPTATS